jgi:hypothetical protein
MRVQKRRGRVLRFIALLSCFSGCGTDEPKECAQQPWVVLESEFAAKRDRDALIEILMDRTGSGVAGGCGDAVNTFTVQLGSDPDSFTRQRILEIVSDVESQLPEGHPFTITVESLDDAIADHEAWIVRLRSEVARMRELHAG